MDISIYIYIYKVRNISRPYRGKIFYVDDTFLPVLDDFDEICRREGETRSKKIREFIERYVLVHSEGNPQMLLEKYFEELQARKKCFWCGGHFEGLNKVLYVSGLVAPTCDECLEQNRAKGSFSTVKRVMGKL